MHRRAVWQTYGEGETIDEKSPGKIADDAAEQPPPFPGLEHAERHEPFESRLPKEGRFPCSQCGAKLNFSPTQASLKCPYCGYVEEIPQSEDEVAEQDFHEHLAKHSDAGSIVGLQNEVHCDNCGATVLVESATVADRCVYCDTPQKNLPTEAADLISPNGLLPFKITAREARERFRKWIAGLWFAPSDLIQSANAGKINGVYLPHWTYDSMTVTHYSGMRGDDYWVTETYMTTDAKGNSVPQTRQVRRTRWRAVSGRVDHWFDDVLVLATPSLPEKFVRRLPPWDLQNVVPFDLAYLTGFRAERYQTDLEAGFVAAKQIMEEHIRGLCCQDIGGDHQKIHSLRTKHMGVTFKHLLLPIWHSGYRYRGKLFRFVINARTGKVQGDRPISWWKVGFAVAGGIALIAAVIGLAAYFGG